MFVSQTACGEAKKCMRPYSLMSVCLSAWEVLHVCIPKPTKEPISHISSLEAELLYVLHTWLIYHSGLWRSNGIGLQVLILLKQWWWLFLYHSWRNNVVFAFGISRLFLKFEIKHPIKIYFLTRPRCTPCAENTTPPESSPPQKIRIEESTMRISYYVLCCWIYWVTKYNHTL